MKNKILTLIGLAFVFSLSISTAKADLIVFDLWDSDNGNKAPPLYGLRLDGLYDGDSDDVYTFSFDSITMTVDTVAHTAFISGSLLGGSEDDGEDRDTDWLLEFTYSSGITVAADGSWTFTGTQGGPGNYSNFGTLTNSDNGDVFGLAEYMGSDGFGPKDSPFNAECKNGDDAGPWCGNGWLSHTTFANEMTYSYEHYSANDFLFQGAPQPGIPQVPEPNSLMLFLLALVTILLPRFKAKLLN